MGTDRFHNIMMVEQKHFFNVVKVNDKMKMSQQR